MYDSGEVKNITKNLEIWILVFKVQLYNREKLQGALHVELSLLYGSDMLLTLFWQRSSSFFYNKEWRILWITDIGIYVILPHYNIKIQYLKLVNMFIKLLKFKCVL